MATTTTIEPTPTERLAALLASVPPSLRETKVPRRDLLAAGIGYDDRPAATVGEVVDAIADFAPEVALAVVERMAARVDRSRTRKTRRAA